MKNIFKIKIILLIVITTTSLLISCVDNKSSKPNAENIALNEATIEIKKAAQQLSDEFKTYWYTGEAEITSYQLEQARYGEIREGKAVLIFVTENFLPQIQVKADEENPSNISVLKLNATKKFNTGIYP